MEAEQRKQEEKKKKKRENGGFSCRVKKGCLSAVVSLQQSLAYVKAFFVGQGKQLTARNEEEAAVAELETSKMQVKAADTAEDAKNLIR